MRLVVLVPRRDTPERVENHEAVAEHLEGFGEPVFYGDAKGDLFSPGRSINLAAQEAGEWDVAIINEADCWVEYAEMRRAAEHAAKTHKLTWAYDKLISLSEAQTVEFHKGERAFDHREARRYLTWPEYDHRGLARGGPRAVSRQLWDTIGGFDDEYEGWGAEDDDFWYKCQIVSGKAKRSEGLCYQLGHPRTSGHYDKAVVAANRRRLKRLRSEVRTLDDLRRNEQHVRREASA